ncbi:hypothetical protein H8E88_06055 [candidate division KSB1 bacterium]|nr:hypothetical protein [candidate division KSB1 bacterium]MBL7095186.1 hypothetical protein [candidate division KSB1 bacterium]
MTEKELKSSLEIFAHKIKNPIHAAVINLDVLKVKLGKLGVDKKTLKHLEIVAAEVKRINEINKKYFGYLALGETARKKKNLKKILG